MLRKTTFLCLKKHFSDIKHNYLPILSDLSTPRALSYHVGSPGGHISYLEWQVGIPRGRMFAFKEHVPIDR